jgi:uncharacterized protein YndB with AHSA1/START domain
MIDIPGQLEAIYREVEARELEGGGEGVGVLLRRRYGAPIEDVWDAVTDPVRMKRWFLPVSGDLRAGGTFQLEGNAGGQILSCEPPRLLRVTFGAPTSVVELRLSPDEDGDTVLELEHTVPLEMARSVAGALYVGPGWDGALMALDLFLRGDVPADPVAAASSPEAQEFGKESVHAWTAVVESEGSATTDDIAAATEASLAQFAPDLQDTDGSSA